MTDLTHGIDVANWQNEIDWPQVPAGFAWAKASESLTYHDPTFPANVAGARAAGIPVGGYHFARPNATADVARGAIMQAQWFRVVCGHMDLPAVLDAEAGWRPNRQENTDWVLAWFDSIAEPVKLLYTNGDGLDHLVPLQLIDAGIELWHANPSGTPNLGGSHGWAASVVQYGSGPLPGIAGNVDFDAMTPDTLNRYIGPTPGDDDVPVQMIFRPPAGHHDPVTGAPDDDWRVLGAQNSTEAVRLSDPNHEAHYLAKGVPELELAAEEWETLVIREPGHYKAG